VVVIVKVKTTQRGEDKGFRLKVWVTGFSSDYG